MIHIVPNALEIQCHFRVIGLPPEDEWPTDVTLSRKHFPPLLPRPITDLVPEINEQAVQLLLVRLRHELKIKVSVHLDW